MGRLRVTIAKALLSSFPAQRSPEYLPIDKVTRNVAMGRARRELEDERAGGFLRFFPSRSLPGGDLLDFGCGYGGRTVEFQRLAGGFAVGFDVETRMIGPALEFARAEGAPRVAYAAGIGEALPFADESFDVVVSYDVFEHVHDPEICLAECLRVLRPGGRLMIVFPPYYHPTGSHLEGYLSHLPWANVLFDQKTLLRAVDELLEERGDGFRPRPLRPGDPLYCLNGITIRAFRAMLARAGFEVESVRLLPLFSRHNRRYDAWRMRYYAWVFMALSRVPGLRELFTHRVVAVLRRPGAATAIRRAARTGVAMTVTR